VLATVDYIAGQAAETEGEFPTEVQKSAKEYEEATE
jgi:hypothetical protein